MARRVINPNGYAERTVEEIAADLGLTRQRVQQISGEATQKLCIYFERVMGRPPQEAEELVYPFTAGPDPLGVMDAWINHKADRKRQRV